MIDKEEVKIKFIKYTDKYKNISKAQLKIDHTLRVAYNAYELATSLNLNNEDKDLAYLIGILHDIGRFEQVKRYNTFSDKISGVNHGTFGAKLLFEENLIRYFIEDNQYDSIIKEAVINHNRNEIDDSLDERHKLFCKIIRDADMTDIIYLESFESVEDIFKYKDFSVTEINKELLDNFLAENKLDYSKIRTSLDDLISVYSYAYQINYKYSYKKIIENKLYENITERFKKIFTGKGIDKYIDILCNKSLSYLNNKINN